MHIFISGATGLIGRHLHPFLNTNGTITVLTRTPEKASKLLDNINTVTEVSSVDFNTIDIVINLAGEPIANKRWSDEQKQKIRNSRINITQQISAAIKKCKSPPHTFISGSAVGFYGQQDDSPIDESFNKPHDEFSHQLCKEWENAALEAKSDATRVCLLRTGIVLAKQGGALNKMLPAYKLCLGGPIGSGKQGMSWIHIDDIVNLILFIIADPTICGPINASAPNPVSNAQFSKQLGSALSRPAIMPMPAFVLKVLLGEMSELLTTGQFVIPTKALEHGYKFKYPHLGEALRSLM